MITKLGRGFEGQRLHGIEPQCRVTRLAKWREHPHRRGLPASLESVPHSPFEDVTLGKVVGWMLARSGKFRPEAEAQLDQITQMDGTLAQPRELTQGFLDLIRHHSGEGLDAWLNDMRASTIREFLTLPAVSSGTKLRFWRVSHFPPYSTGPVEGHINHLKLIKRQAYGRAGLLYLQRRFLSAA